MTKVIQLVGLTEFESGKAIAVTNKMQSNAANSFGDLKYSPKTQAMIPTTTKAKYQPNRPNHRLKQTKHTNFNHLKIQHCTSNVTNTGQEEGSISWHGG